MIGVAPGCRTSSQTDKAVRFGVVTDCHYAEREASGRRFYRLAKAKFSQSISVFNTRGVDFLIELGDLKDAGDTSAETLGYLEVMETEFAQFRGPRYHVLGNHDMDRITKEEFLSRVSNAGQNRALAHYSFTRGGVTFIVLDANYRADGESYANGNYDWTDTFVPDDQLRWLREELDSAEGPVVVFCHQRLDADGDPHTVKNAPAVRQVLESGGKVIGVLQGHDHLGGERCLNGIVYRTFPGVIVGETLAANPRFEVTITPNREMQIVRLP